MRRRPLTGNTRMTRPGGERVGLGRLRRCHRERARDPERQPQALTDVVPQANGTSFGKPGPTCRARATFVVRKGLSRARASVFSRVELNGTRSTLRKSRGGRRNPPLPHEAVDYAQGVPPTRAATAPRPAQRIARRTFTGPLSLSRFFCQTSRSEDGLEYSRKKSSCLGKSQHMSTIRATSASV